MFNVIRGDEIPPSLAEGLSWSGSDVVQRLRDIFHDKCYICETKEPLSLNVEHFDAHQGDAQKKFRWDNLFYACGRCNNIKRHLFNNLIDCSDPNTDALRLIRHAPPLTPFSRTVVIEAMDEDPKTIQTANLIRKVFNEDNTGNKEVTGAYLRKRVYRKYAKLLGYLNVYIDDDSLEAQKHDAIAHIKQLMSKTQEYSAFLRWAVMDSPELLEEVQDSID